MIRWYAQRYWIYAGLVAVLLLDAVIYFGSVLRPPMEPENAQAQVAALEREVGERSAEVSRLERVRDQLPQLRPRLDEFTSEHLPGERDGFSAVAADLQEAATRAGVALESVAYQSEEAEERPELLRVEIRVTVEGLYANLLGYLEELERSPRFYLIDELGVVGARGRGLRLEMTVATYFRRAP
jgi:Tfp pilus assembly protein PilO